MSRNGSGVYSLPAGNPVVTGTTISSSWANTTLSDIATALTGSVAADGQTAMTGNLQMGNNKITGLAVATSSGDALSYGQAATVSSLTVSGAFAANGGATLGDASGDALTINSSAVSIPNGLNFDSNTLVIDSTNDRVGVGTSSPSAKLDVAGLGVFAKGSTNGITIGDVTTNSNAVLRLQGTSAGKNFQIANNLNVGGLEFTPSTADGGTTYTTPAMVVTSAGNVGIGTSSPNSAGVNRALTISGSSNSILELNAGSTRCGYMYATTAATIFSAVQASSIMQFNTVDTERMRIDSSGNVGIGTSSPSRKLSVYDTSNIPVRIETNTSDTKIEILTTSGTQFIQGSANNLLFGTNNTERMRIDSSGNLLVGTTSVLYSSGQQGLSVKTTGGYALVTQPASNNYNSLSILNASGTLIGSVYGSSTATNYNTSSDYRLKNNQAPLTGSGAFIDALQPKTWTWNIDGSTGVGFIAHEAQAVSPSSVVGEKDAVDKDGKPQYQAMEYGSAEFIANIIAELQDLRKRVAVLESK